MPLLFSLLPVLLPAPCSSSSPIFPLPASCSLLPASCSLLPAPRLFLPRPSILPSIIDSKPTLWHESSEVVRSQFTLISSI